MPLLHTLGTAAQSSRGGGGGWRAGGLSGPVLHFLPTHPNFSNHPIPTVMHESSRKVAETLQEIYSTEWDGHVELKAIADVSTAVPCGMGSRR